ncbi:MAG: hypothetical protein V1809_00305 [Planctomycetota bacterium]
MDTYLSGRIPRTASGSMPLPPSYFPFGSSVFNLQHRERHQERPAIGGPYRHSKGSSSRRTQNSQNLSVFDSRFARTRILENQLASNRNMAEFFVGIDHIRRKCAPAVSFGLPPGTFFEFRFEPQRRDVPMRPSFRGGFALSRMQSEVVAPEMMQLVREKMRHMVFKRTEPEFKAISAYRGGRIGGQSATKVNPNGLEPDRQIPGNWHPGHFLVKT